LSFQTRPDVRVFRYKAGLQLMTQDNTVRLIIAAMFVCGDIIIAIIQHH
jgi:hypothetical protein